MILIIYSKMFQGNLYYYLFKGKISEPTMGSFVDKFRELTYILYFVHLNIKNIFHIRLANIA